MSRMRLITLRLPAILVLSFVSVHALAQLKQSELGTEIEWLSWHPEQRSAYVYGYIDGYLQGTISSCHVADELFERGQSHSLGDGDSPTDTPFSRCLARRGEFSDRKDIDGHPDLTAYADAVTVFYERHTTCREFPFAFLLKFLSSKYSTADQLYESISRGELTGRGREWCHLDSDPKN